MTMIAEILSSVIGLFVDDEFLAVAVLAVVALSSLMIIGLAMEPLWAGAVLLGGNVLVLILGAVRTARNGSKR